MQKVHANSDRNFSLGIFAYQLYKPSTNRFSQIKDKQPQAIYRSQSQQNVEKQAPCCAENIYFEYFNILYHEVSRLLTIETSGIINVSGILFICSPRANNITYIHMSLGHWYFSFALPK